MKESVPWGREKVNLLALTVGQVEWAKLTADKLAKGEQHMRHALSTDRKHCVHVDNTGWIAGERFLIERLSQSTNARTISRFCVMLLDHML